MSVSETNNTTLLRRRTIIMSCRRNVRAPAKSVPPNELQTAALVAARDHGTITRQNGAWIAIDVYGHPYSPHDGTTISACRRRGWLADAPGYEHAIRPSRCPVVITDAGRMAITKGGG